jgi:Spy/CpxP family protein refolding chaperone
MEKCIRKVFVCCVTGMFILSAFGVFAWSEGRGGERGARTGRWEKFSRELGLSQEQKDALRDRKEAAAENKAAAREEVKAAREALREALKKPELDIEDVNSASERVKDTQGVLVDHRVESFLSMREILTPEQFEKMMEMKSDMGTKRGEKRRKNR